MSPGEGRSPLGRRRLGGEDLHLDHLRAAGAAYDDGPALRRLDSERRLAVVTGGLRHDLATGKGDAHVGARHRLSLTVDRDDDRVLLTRPDLVALSRSPADGRVDGRWGYDRRRRAAVGGR